LLILDTRSAYLGVLLREPDAGAAARSLGALRSFCARRERQLIWALLGLAALTRCLLIIGSPTPFGYVYDFYPAAVAYVYDHHVLPPPNACWICAHPPLFWIVGAPFYALGMWLSHGQRAVAEQVLCAVPLACDALTILYTYRLLRLYRQRGLFLLCGVALCAFFPCLAISSHGPESDMLLTALMVAGVFHLCRMHVRWLRDVRSDVIWLGSLCGLAALTKYSGVLLLVAAAAVLAARAWRGPLRVRAVTRGGLIFGLAFGLGGAKYAYNYAVHHDLLLANGSAQSGFAVLDFGSRAQNLGYYDFASLKLSDAVALFEPERADGVLTTKPVYASVWTTLHTMAWTDMSMFSVHARHGDPHPPYPSKHIPIPLVTLMLYLGLVPTALALIGFGLAAHRRTLWPLSFFATTSSATYLWWFLAQDSWALKTKYLLFLLPVYVLFALLGLHRVLGLCGRCGQATATATLTLLSALYVSSVAYLMRFAIG
jgi:4-amino-4-deoxy-L-arabinose transferase-like glycosyltransferase